MKSVYKYEIKVEDDFTVAMPRGARVVSVGVQMAIPYMWVEVEPGASLEKRVFHVHGTGHQIPDQRQYLGTFQLIAGQFIGHLYE